MLWTVLAVVLILNGFFHNDAWETASAVLFGALGVRRAVMQWDKPRALMNFGVIVFALGLALWQMGRGDAKKEVARVGESAPAVAQERTTAPPPRPAVSEAPNERPALNITTSAPSRADGETTWHEFPEESALKQVSEEDNFSNGTLKPDEEIFYGENGEIEIDGAGRSKELIFAGTEKTPTGVCALTLGWSGTANGRPIVKVRHSGSDEWLDYIAEVNGDKRWLLWEVTKIRIDGMEGAVISPVWVSHVCKRSKQTSVKALASAPTGEDIEQSSARGYAYVFGNEPVMPVTWSEWIPNEKGCKILFDSADSFKFKVEIRTFDGGSFGGWLVDSPDGDAFISPEGVNYSANVASVRAQVLGGTPNNFRYRQLCSK